MAHGENPRSRLIRFSKNSGFHYFTVDEMGLRLMKLALDEMTLYRFQRYLQQNGICKASMLPLYLFSLELLSEDVLPAYRFHPVTVDREITLI